MARRLWRTCRRIRRRPSTSRARPTKPPCGWTSGPSETTPLSIGDDNPLYTDPEYGRRSRYGSQLAPGPILALIRYPSAHGAKRPQGYPMANFISGTAWEFYDVIRAGAKFRSSKVTKELIERSGSQGKLVFLISECYYHDFHGDMPAKCYGTQIMVPQRNMESSRAVPRERLGTAHDVRTQGVPVQPGTDREVRGDDRRLPTSWRRAALLGRRTSWRRDWPLRSAAVDPPGPGVAPLHGLLHQGGGESARRRAGLRTFLPPLPQNRRMGARASHHPLALDARFRARRRVAGHLSGTARPLRLRRTAGPDSLPSC